MEKIEKCSCGGEGVLWSEDEYAPYLVACEKCGKESLSWATKIKAIRNWNKINKVRSEMTA